MQGFQTILFLVAEQKHADKGTGSQMLSQTDQGDQSLNLFAEIRRATSRINMFRSLCEQIQHEACMILSILLTVKALHGWQSLNSGHKNSSKR